MKHRAIFFGNIFINSEESFLRMKDSFNSFNAGLFENMIINVRGSYQKQASEFLLKNGVINIYNLESSLGWFHDSYSLLKDITQSYVFLWLEDFICLNSNDLEKYIESAINNKLDIARYTYKKNTILTFSREEILYQDETSLFFNAKPSSFLETSIFIISYASLVHKSLLFKVLLEQKNSIWDVKTPFGFEQDSSQVHWLPLKMGFLKNEIIASIDDDHDEVGSSLQSRGLYPVRTQVRTNSKHLSPYLQSGKKYKLKVLRVNFYRIFQLLVALVIRKVKFNLFLKLMQNLNHIDLNLYSFDLLNKLNLYKSKKILLITLNNELVELTKLLITSEIKIISNLRFENDIRSQINLQAVPINFNQKHDQSLIYQGYLVDVNIDFSSTRECQIFIKKVIYHSLSKEMKSKIVKLKPILF